MNFRIPKNAQPTDLTKLRAMLKQLDKQNKNNYIKDKAIDLGIGVAGCTAGGLISNKVIKRSERKKTKTASELINLLYKSAELESPTEEEKKKENNEASNNTPGTDSSLLDASQNEIQCEVCGYQGIPDHYGYCPECGALGGHQRQFKPQSLDGAIEVLDPQVLHEGNLFEESLHSFQE